MFSELPNSETLFHLLFLIVLFQLQKNNCPKYFSSGSYCLPINCLYGKIFQPKRPMSSKCLMYDRQKVNMAGH